MFSHRSQNVCSVWQLYAMSFSKRLVASILWFLICCSLPASLAGRVAAANSTATATNRVRITGTMVDVRAGPSLAHEIRMQVQLGDEVTAYSRSADGEWLLIADPQGGPELLWLYASLTDIGTALGALPTGAHPAVCTRSLTARTVLLASLALLGRTRTCAEVTWPDLASLHVLALAADETLWVWEAHDVDGLTGLREARISVGERYIVSGGRLAGLAGLERLTLLGGGANIRTWPAGWLQGAARLQSVEVRARGLTTLSTDFLQDVDCLRDLHMDTPALRVLPAALLQDTPCLQTLHMDMPALMFLSDGFLAKAPQLQSLTLYGRAVLPADFLSASLQLRRLDLRLSQLDPLVSNLDPLVNDYLSGVLPLRSLTLSLGHGYSLLPEGFLAHAADLETLNLVLSGVEVLPSNFLQASSQLRSVVLRAPLKEWPPQLFAYAPYLETLELHATHHASDLSLPMGFLSNAPRLKSLLLGYNLLLPAHFLAEPSRLEEADLFLRGLLPTGLLAKTPRLRDLRLGADLAQAEGFLGSAPSLQHLALHSEGQTVQAGLLTGAPNLASLVLDYSSLEQLPLGLLAGLPHLQSLTLGASSLKEPIPTDLLATVPRLQSLDLQLAWWRRDTTVAPSALEDWIPTDLLVAVPHLQSLDLQLAWWGYYWDTKLPLAPDLLAGVPELTELSLSLKGMTIPQGFFEATPNLKKVALKSDDLTSLPTYALAGALNLEEVALLAPNLATWPDGFLSDAPRLRAIYGDFPDVPNTTHLTSIGSHVLAGARGLEHFALFAPSLTAIGPGFLAGAENLRTVQILYHGQTLTLPPDFLADAPQLRQIRMENEYRDGLLNIPADFLAGAPRLERVFLATLPDPFPSGLLRDVQLEEAHLSMQVRVPPEQASRWLIPIQAKKWRLELTCDSAYLPAYVVHWQPEAQLTLALCSSSKPFPTTLLRDLPDGTQIELMQSGTIEGNDADKAKTDLFSAQAPAISGFAFMARPDVFQPVEPLAEILDPGMQILHVQGQISTLPENMLQGLSLTRLTLDAPYDSALWSPRLLDDQALEWFHLQGGYLEGVIPPHFFDRMTAQHMLLTLAVYYGGPFSKASDLVDQYAREDIWVASHIGEWLTRVQHLGVANGHRAMLPLSGNFGEELRNIAVECVDLLLPIFPSEHLLADLANRGVTVHIETLPDWGWAEGSPRLDTLPPLGSIVDSVRRMTGSVTERLSAWHPHIFESYHLPWATRNDCPRSLSLIGWWPTSNLLLEVADLERVRIGFDSALCAIVGTAIWIRQAEIYECG